MWGLSVYIKFKNVIQYNHKNVYLSFGQSLAKRVLPSLGILFLISCSHNVQCSSILPDHLKPAAGDMTAFLEADPAELFDYHLCRAKNDEEAGQYYVGIAYQEGLGVGQDYSEAIKWYKRAAESKSDLKWNYGSEIATKTRPIYPGYKEAQFQLGMIYFYGLGTERNKKLAKKWFNQSAAQGYFPAKSKLLELRKINNSDNQL